MLTSEGLKDPSVLTSRLAKPGDVLKRREAPCRQRLGSSVVEQPPCKRQVGGSNPFPGSLWAPLKSWRRLLPYPGVSGRGSPGVLGGVPERPKGADCKSAGFAYGGSNPPAPTEEYAPL